MSSKGSQVVRDCDLGQRSISDCWHCITRNVISSGMNPRSRYLHDSHDYIPFYLLVFVMKKPALACPWTVELFIRASSVWVASCRTHDRRDDREQEGCATRVESIISLVSLEMLDIREYFIMVMYWNAIRNTQESSSTEIMWLWYQTNQILWLGVSDEWILPREIIASLILPIADHLTIASIESEEEFIEWSLFIRDLRLHRYPQQWNVFVVTTQIVVTFSEQVDMSLPPYSDARILYGPVSLKTETASSRWSKDNREEISRDTLWTYSTHFLASLKRNS